MRRVTANDFDFTSAPLFRKCATIPVANVVFAKGGEKVVTLQSGAAGQFAETINIAQLGDAIVTRSAGDSYIPKKFSNNFEINPANSDEYRSKNFGCAIFQDEDFVIMAPWGEDQTIAAGGVIFQSLAGDTPEVYGNQGRSFEADYAREAADGSLLPLTLPLKTHCNGRPTRASSRTSGTFVVRAVYARKQASQNSLGTSDEVIRMADIVLNRSSRADSNSGT